LIVLSDPASLRTAVLVVALVLAWAAALIYFFRERKKRRESAPPPQGVAAQAPELQSPRAVLEPEPSGAPSQTWFQQLSDVPSLAVRMLRASLVLLALIVAAGFVLLILPQGMMEKMVQTVRATKAADLPSEKIALLYLGDEVKGDEVHIRGVVRNISSEPVEKLDATVRLYSGDNTLLETVVVRMHLEVIPPDAISEFHLSYPKYNGQFTSYSVDFKLRQGDPISYKDRRAVRYLN